MSYLFSKATSKLNKNEACCPSPPRMSMWKLLSNCRVKCRTIKCSLSSGLYLAGVARLRQGREIAWCQSGSGENINAQQLAQAAGCTAMLVHRRGEGDRFEISSNFQENVQLETHFMDLHQLCAKSSN